MIFKELSFADRGMVESYLRPGTRRLSAYSFAQIAVWRALYTVEWAIIEGALCLFFKDRFGSFMNCEPLGPNITADTVERVFSVMDACNKNPAYSRIENVEKSRIGFYNDLGYEAVEKSGDYLYERSSLAALRGDAYKSKRASCNMFAKSYACEYLVYKKAYRRECVDLYDRWARGRRATTQDSLYSGMLDDQAVCLGAVLKDPEKLGLTGRVVKVAGKIRAFTFGCELDHQTYCVVYEIADLSFKGIAQYIFRQVCAEMDKYRYINAMDDSGLKRLESVKSSYRPARKIPAYIIQRTREQTH